MDKVIKTSAQIIKSCVPQGSVLGHVKFLLFVNDMHLFIGETDVDKYADDTTVRASDKESKNVERWLQVGTCNFKSYCVVNKHTLSINLNKTSLMILEPCT